MDAWKEDVDIARDLDILSGITSSTTKVKAYNSWSRGRRIPELPRPKEDQEFNLAHEQFGGCQPNLGRGQKLEFMKMKCRGGNKEAELQWQLRSALGPGYSNELIESAFGNIQRNAEKEQFQDDERALGSMKLPTPSKGIAAASEDKDSGHSSGGGASPVHARAIAAASVPSRITSETAEDSGVFSLKVNEDGFSKVKGSKKPRRCKNAVLASLAKLKTSCPDVTKEVLKEVPTSNTYCSISKVNSNKNPEFTLQIEDFPKI